MQPSRVPSIVLGDEQRLETAVHEKTKDMAVNTEHMRWLHDELANRFGVQCVSLRDSELRRHSADLSQCEPCPPDLLFYPEDAYQIGWLLEHLEEGVSVVPFGRGTSTEGQAMPCGPATISLDLHRMRRIIEFNRVDRMVRVETGLDLAALNLALQEDGLCFPIDPMMNATIGGMISDSATGLSVCRYGSLAANLQAIKVVLADGRAVEIQNQDFLKGLFVGSEGRLGVVVEATLRLKPIPTGLKTIWAAFSRLEDAAMAIPTVLDGQSDLVKCVLLSACAIQAINKEHSMTLADRPALLIQIEGDSECILKDSPAVFGLEEETGEAAAVVWDRLGAVWFAGRDSAPTTVRVAPTRIAEIVREFHRDGTADLCLLANCAVGNVTMVKPASESQAFCEELFPLVRKLGGSLCGHGLAPQLKAWVGEEFGSAGTLLQAIKKALDPRGILGHDNL